MVQLIGYVPDYESKAFVEALPKMESLWDADTMAKAKAFVRERAEMVRAGVQRCPSWFQEDLNRLDSRLRCWWNDWKQEWTIDRLQDEGIVEGMLRLSADQPQEEKEALRNDAKGLIESGCYYLTVMAFQPRGELQLDARLLQCLREMDMQRFASPAEWLLSKRNAAKKQQEANDKAANEKVMAAVDSLSSKSLETMGKVFQAFETGETIIAHGDDAKILERVTEERKRTPAVNCARPNIFKKPRRKAYHR